MLPVPPQEPAAADAPFNASVSAAPVPENHWSWASAPTAATAAFLATLGALLLGYWTGYAIGSEAVGKTAATVVSASEKTPSRAIAELTPIPEREPATPTPAIEEQAAAERQPAEGLHLQVSALSNERAASALRRRLESQGFPVRVEAPSKDDLVRVYVGPIADSADLDEWASELRKEGLKPFPKRL